MIPPHSLRTHSVYTIAIIGFIYTLHLVLPLYSNASFLGLFADERTVGFIYMAGAAVSIFGFLLAPGLIRRWGNYTTAAILICIQIALFYTLAVSHSPFIIATAFILQAAVVSLIAFSLDIFLEVFTDGHHVGSIRGLYSASLNASWLVAPLLGSLLIGASGNYRNTYIAALVMLFPLLYLVYRNFEKFKDPLYSHQTPWQIITHISRDTNRIKLFFANIILQSFYAWMVVYSAIYLHGTIGFTWEEIAIILTVMLVPFVLIQYPLGKLADSKYGEKEMMAIGFGIMGISTIILSFVTIKSLVLWALLLFITRLGAATVEIMMEIYFFKTVPTRDTAVLGMFRITRPIAYFIAPLITGFALLFTVHQYIFIFVGVMCLVGLYPALTIKDTN
jgi:MFS family permease